jgi:hypothetical protein
MSDRTAPSLLHDQLAHAFAAAQWQVQDLDDDEYFWEPVPECWSVRRRRDARTSGACGVGDWVIDGEWPLTGPPPVTTIAFRVVHLAAWTDIYRDFTFGTASMSYLHIDVPGSATDAVAWLQRAQDAFAAAARAVPDAETWSMRPTHYGQQRPAGTLIWQIAVEHLHHSAEIGVLRDLRRGHARSDWWPEPQS